MWNCVAGQPPALEKYCGMPEIRIVELASTGAVGLKVIVTVLVTFGRRLEKWMWRFTNSSFEPELVKRPSYKYVSA